MAEQKTAYKDELSFEDAVSAKSHSSHDHRTGSSFGAYFNIVCAIAGTGTLGLPGAMAKGGWITLLFFGLVASVSIFTGRLLVECLYYKPDQRLEELPDIGEAAFGKFGRYFTKVFHYSISLSSACIYILLIGLNIFEVLEKYNNGNTYLSKEMWIFFSGVAVLVPFALLKTLKEVAWLAAFGAVSTLVVVFCVAIQGGIDYSNLDLSQLSSVETKLAIPGGIPGALATIAFSYGGNVVYPHVEASMKHPQSWNRVLVSAILSITGMYVIVSACGYRFYGASVQSPVLDSLSVGGGSLVAYIFITLHVLLAAPIYMCSFALEQERWLKIDRNYLSAPKELVYRVALRTFIAASMTAIAVVVPHFSQLMALVGAVSNCTIVFLIPVAFHFKLFGWRNRSIFCYAMSIFVVCLGVFGLILGTRSAITDLVDVIKTGGSAKPTH